MMRMMTIAISCKAYEEPAKAGPSYFKFARYHAVVAESAMV